MGGVFFRVDWALLRRVGAVLRAAVLVLKRTAAGANESINKHRYSCLAVEPNHPSQYGQLNHEKNKKEESQKILFVGHLAGVSAPWNPLYTMNEVYPWL